MVRGSKRTITCTAQGDQNAETKSTRCPETIQQTQIPKINWATGL